MGRIDIDVLDRGGVDALLDRAAAEGWNPGVDDAAAFHAADPEGFRALAVDGRFAAGISVVRQDATRGFLGLYIAAPEARGRGHGLALWRAALGAAEARGIESVGLDGVVEQQANYRRSGFAFAHRNLRFAGTPDPDGFAGDVPGVAIRAVSGDDLGAVTALDAEIGGVPRERFWRAWLAPAPDSRLTLAAFPDGNGDGHDRQSHGDATRPVGVATIRRCRSGHKIGPLLAPHDGVARALVGAALDATGASEIVLDVPEPNARATALAAALGLSPAFETARMYRGPAPAIDLGRLYGVATFELG